jgi:hypothetical protein
MLQAMAMAMDIQTAVPNPHQMEMATVSHQESTFKIITDEI